MRDLVGTKLGEALTWLAALVQGVVTSSIAILNIVSLVVVTPIVTFFLLRDWEKIVAQIDSYLPRQSLETVRGQARLISDTLVGFVHGQALVCLILAIYYGIALTHRRARIGLALGLLIGVLAIIPILGVAHRLRPVDRARRVAIRHLDGGARRRRRSSPSASSPRPTS